MRYYVALSNIPTGHIWTKWWFSPPNRINKIVLVGDLNLPDISWNNNATKHKTSSKFLTYVDDKATIWDPSILDLFFWPIRKNCKPENDRKNVRKRFYYDSISDSKKGKALEENNSYGHWTQKDRCHLTHRKSRWGTTEQAKRKKGLGGLAVFKGYHFGHSRKSIPRQHKDKNYCRRLTAPQNQKHRWRERRMSHQGIGKNLQGQKSGRQRQHTKGKGY